MDYELIEDGKVIKRDGWDWIWMAYWDALVAGRKVEIRRVG